MTLVDPTGLFSGLPASEDACVLYLPKFSFLKEWHSHAQCLGLLQLWHLPLHFLHPLALSEWVAVRASSVFPLLPSFPWVWWYACWVFKQSASLQMVWSCMQGMLTSEAVRQTL